MKAVATVTMNRVNATEGEYARISQGGSVRNIIKHVYFVVETKTYMTFQIN